MKITTFLLLANLLTVTAAHSYSQRSRVSINADNNSITDVLDELESQLKLSILYSIDELDEEKRITAKFEDTPVEDVLSYILKDQKVGYAVKDDKIIISQKRFVPPLPTKQQEKETILLQGKVADKDGNPIPGVNVMVKGTTNGTTTNPDGSYKLNVPVGAETIVFSFIGMKTQEVPFDDKARINVVLRDDAKGLDEIMVVGYGTQRKASIVGSISTIDVAKLPVRGASISNTLAGQLSGIVAMTRSGEPGKNSAAEFYIRGISSFTGSTKPLVLVDGIERDLDLVDTEDIQSFSVLKDASASAVYGVRGANGVIIIKTRSGSKGKPQIKVRSEAGITSPTRMPNLANSFQFAEMYNEASGSNYYTDDVLEKYRLGTDTDLYPNVDWIKELYKSNATNKRINMNVSGGGKIANYYVSGSFYTENSIFKDAGDIYDYNSSIKYDRYNFRANVDFNLTQSTVLNVNMSNIYEKSFGPGSDKNSIWSYTFATSPNAFPLEYSDGTISAPSTSSGYNPWNLLVHSGYREQFWNSAQSLIGINQDLKGITKGLKANIKFSWDAFNTTLQTRSKEPKQFHATGRDDENNLIFGNPIYEGSETLSYKKESQGSITTYLEASLTYNRLFNEVHRVGGLFLYNHKVRNNTQAGSQAASLPYKHQGIAARVTYAYKDTYFIEYNMGYNGSENFARGHRFGFFPAGAIGWMVSNEEWFKPFTKTVNLLKIKASHGKVGNDAIGGGRRWIYEPTIVEGSEWHYGQTGNLGGKGIRIGDVENLNVSWEEVVKTNIGVEISFFDALKIQADYFQEKRDGVFLKRAGLPALAGLSNVPYVNIGKAENKGFDSSLEYSQKVGEVLLTGRGTFTYARNTLLNNDEPDWKYKYQNRIGKSIGQPFGLIALGLFESQEQIDNSPKQTFGEYRVGDVRYADINGDGLINSYDKVAIGHPKTPEIVYGLGLNAQWRNFDVNVFFQGVDHTSFFIGGTAIRPFSSNNLERSAFHEALYHESWKTTNTEAQNAQATFPRLSIGGGAGSSNNSQNSTMNQRDGSFIRLKNVEIGYTFPKHILNKTFLKSARIYVSGNNLHTWSSFKLWDPEKGGGDGSGYPPNKIISVGFTTHF
ncbi:SusC/RagA family TonB-linked outer membrane protein [Prolixibacteraceae bacterium JC049]|nr:SusC/RagA family TonB-linked outer membrane protein [Prolixibacteraceae bacterium JC049]